MPERIDRRIAGDRTLFWLLAALFAVAAIAGVFVWLRISAPTESQKQATQQPAMTQPAGAEPFTVTLFYPVDGMLTAGPSSVKRQPDIQSQAREALVAVFADPRTAQTAILKEVKLRGFFFEVSGTAYVDLSPLQQNGVKASAGEELLAVYTLVNTLTNNFEEIKQVRILIDGKEAQTLAGHIDLSRNFEKRMDLVRQ